MKLSLELLERELDFINRRIKIIRSSKEPLKKGLSLKECFEFKKDYESAINELNKLLK